MEWFRNLFRENPPTISDFVFGELTFEELFWVHYPSAPDDLMVSIDAPEAGPSDLQREFHKNLREKLPLLKEIAKDYIQRELNRVMKIPRLSIYSVEICSDAEIKNQKFVLEMTDDEQDTIHRVTFESERPIHYTFDH